MDKHEQLPPDLGKLGPSEIKQTQENRANNDETKKYGMTRGAFIKGALLTVAAAFVPPVIEKLFNKTDNAERFAENLEMLGEIEAALDESIELYSAETQTDEVLQDVAESVVQKCQEAKLDISLVRHKIMNLGEKIEEKDVEDLNEDLARLSETLHELNIDTKKFTENDSTKSPSIIKENLTLHI